MTRRRFLRWMVNGASALIALVITIPSVVSALSPVLRRWPRHLWEPVGPLARFPVGAITKATVTPPRFELVEPMPQQAVYVWRRSESARDVVVMSRACTDLGCPVNYDPGSEFFYCPCHGGIFNRAGEPVAGPPGRPLYRYASRVRDGVLEIDLRSVPPMA